MRELLTMFVVDPGLLDSDADPDPYGSVRYSFELLIPVPDPSVQMLTMKKN